MSDMTEIAAAKIGAGARKRRGEGIFHPDDRGPHQDVRRTEGDGRRLTPKAAIPAALDSSSQSKIDKLKNAKPDDFSSEFDPMQVSAHKDAVSLFERYAKGGEVCQAEGLVR